MAARKPQGILGLLELKVPPVMMTIALAFLMWVVAGRTGSYSMPAGLRIGALLILFAAGTAIGLAGIWSFRKARTTVNPWRPHASSTLVVSGIYRHTRNPMYLALLLALAGWGLYLANLWALLLGFAFVPCMNRFQIRPEERALEQLFGQSFRDYCQRVRRWL
jgi:protein-S-isoprenylcysteine O-methyltransferase Ste14